MPDGHHVPLGSLDQRYKVSAGNALYDAEMSTTGELKVSSRGQMSLPATARHRWGLDGGGEVGYLDIGDAMIIVPGGIERLRRALFDEVSDSDWHEARAGFGDPDLANQ